METSNTVEPSSPRRTRPSNATKRLGLPDLPVKKRTRAEKQADERSLADKRATKAAKAKAAIEHIGRLEQSMETNQAAAIAPVKPVRPRLKTAKEQEAVTREAKPSNGKVFSIMMRCPDSPVE